MDYTKHRSDSWASGVDTETLWNIYFKFRQFNYDRLCAWALKEHGIELPSKSSLYRWRSQMQKLESGHRIEQMIIARSEAEDMALKANIDAPDLIESYKTLACELALKGDAKTAKVYTEMAMNIAHAQLEKQKLQLKVRAQENAEKRLDLDREKFEAAEARLNAALFAAKNLNKSGGLSDEGLAEIERAMSLI